MYSDKEHERVSIAKTKETENIGTSAENGRAMESKPKVGTNTIDIKPRLPFFLSRFGTRAFHSFTDPTAILIRIERHALKREKKKKR